MGRVNISKPPWDADDAFPLKPEGHDYGYLRWGRPVPCSREALIARFGWWKLFYPALVWAPETPRLVTAVEWPPLVEAVRAIRVTRYGLLVGLSLITSWFFAYTMVKSPILLKLPFRMVAGSIATLVVLGLVPLAWAFRRFRAILRAPPDQVTVIGGPARFLAWCRTRRSVATPLIVGALAVSWIGQWIFGVTASLSAAGTDRASILLGEFWRILTSNFLHFDFRHFISNTLEIAVLAWFIERLANRSLLLVLVVASAIGTVLASLAFTASEMSAGASGIGWGLFGFLLVISLLRRTRLPMGMSTLLLWYLAVAVVCEATLWGRFNHAAHGGGLAVGLILGCIHELKPSVQFALTAGRVAAALIIAAAAGSMGAIALKHQGIWGLTRRAYRAADRGRHEEAIKLYSQILQRDPRNAGAHDGRATARWNLDDLEGARADYDSLLTYAPDDERGRIGRGSLRREMGDLEGALEDLDRVLNWDPENAEALSERARVFLLKGDLDSAMKCVNKSVELTKVDDDELLMTARFRDLSQLGDQVHDNLYAHYVRGLVRVALGDLDGAIADFTEAMRNNPDSDYRQTARGEALALKGETEAALTDFEATLREYKDDPDARLGRGRIRVAKGDVPGARADFEVALKNSHRWWRRRAEAEAALKALPTNP